jgi:hypothetical protein
MTNLYRARTIHVATKTDIGIKSVTDMEQATVTMCKALAQQIRASKLHYDHQTSALLVSLADYVRSYETYAGRGELNLKTT